MEYLIYFFYKEYDIYHLCFQLQEEKVYLVNWSMQLVGDDWEGNCDRLQENGIEQPALSEVVNHVLKTSWS